MSHLKERTEKDCLNCGAIVAGRYCQQCGQENVEVKESIWHLIMHFIEDLTHFDGKLWKTLKLLLFKPASLTRHYMDGKRATYLHPIRMYLFISAVFFFFIFAGEVPDKPAMRDLPANAKPPRDIVTSLDKDLSFDEDTTHYSSVAAYTNSQLKLPVEKRAGWLESTVKKKYIELNIKYDGDKFKIGKALIEQFQHYFSRMLYISLPIFAFFVWILYRRNKEHYFVDHLIFSIHIYCAFFIILFTVKIINLITEYFSHQSYLSVANIAGLALFYYLYKSLRNHFKQSRLKTILKFAVLNFMTLILMGFLMFTFILLSFFNI